MAYCTEGYLYYSTNWDGERYRYNEVNFQNFKYIYFTVLRQSQYPNRIFPFSTRANINNIFWATESGETASFVEIVHRSPTNVGSPHTFTRISPQTGQSGTGANMGTDLQKYTSVGGSGVYSNGYRLLTEFEQVAQYAFTDMILYTNIPMFYADDETSINKYITTGEIENNINPNAEPPIQRLFANWVIGYTNSTNTIYSIACDCPLFYDDTSDFYGQNEVAKINLQIQYVIGETLTTIYNNTYAYGQTWTDSLEKIIGGSDTSIANQIANKVATLLDLDRITMFFNVELPDGTKTAMGRVVFDHSNVVDYGFTEQTYGDTITFKSGVVLDDSDSDITNPKADDEETDSTDSKYISEVTSGNLLTQSYAMTKQEIQGIGYFLWGATFLDNVKLVNNNPIENVISCKLFPLNFVGDENRNVWLGNVDSETSSRKMNTTQFLYESNAITVPLYYTNKASNLKFLDYEPYTKIEILLPFIGLKELPVNEIANRQLKLRWWIDVVTGTVETDICVKYGSSDFYPIAIYNSQCGVDIPLTAQNLAQVQSAYIQNAIGGGVALATGNVAGVVGSVAGAVTEQYHTQTHGTPSPACAIESNLLPMLKITRPKISYLGTQNTGENTVDRTKKYRDLMGSPSYIVKNLGSLSGYTEVENPQIAVSGALVEEVEEINRLLSEGVIL